MDEHYIIYNGELYHYGRKGMKWGQHIFGKIKTSLSARRAKKKESREAEKAAENEKRILNTPNRKLTMAELKQKANRLKAEKEVADLQKQLKESQWDELSKGQKFIRTLGKDVINPALKKVATDQLTNLLNGVAGTKVQGVVNAFKAANSSRKSREDQSNSRDAKPETEKPKTEKPKTEKPKKNKKTVFEGEVTGQGTSRYKAKTSKSSKKPSDYYDPIETTGWVHSNSTTSYKRAAERTSYLTSGSNFISGYLN